MGGVIVWTTLHTNDKVLGVQLPFTHHLQYLLFYFISSVLKMCLLNKH